MKARNISMGYVLSPLLLLFLVHTLENISDHLTISAAGPNGDLSAQIRARARFAGPLPNYSFDADNTMGEGVVTSGSMVLLMDEDSFLSQISSEKFWRRKRKKKSGRVSPAQVKKRRAKNIESTPRSGLLTTKPGSGTLFGFFANQEPIILPPKPKMLASNVGIASGGYRTLCVRLSDGYYWPISFSTNRDQFLKDNKVCKRSCAESVRLFVYRNPDGRPEDMVDLKGQRYSDLENAWRYREEYSLQRKCSPHPWEEAALAKHRAYALMAKRSGGQMLADASLSEQRRLVRVGHVRTMSTIDLDYMGNAKFMIEVESWKTQVKRDVASETAPQPKLEMTPRRVMRNAGRAPVTRKIDGSRRMGLGVNAGGAKRRQPAKPVRFRVKSRKRPKWVRDVFSDE